MTANAATLSGEMFVSDNTVNNLSDYTFEVTLRESIPNGGKLQIAFNNQNFAFTDGANYSCQTTYGFQAGATPTCTAVSLNSGDPFGTSYIELTNAFPTEDVLVIFTVQGITNPAYQMGSSHRLRTFDAAGDQLSASGASTFYFNTQPGTLQAEIATVSGASDVVAELSDISVSIEVTNGIPQQGQFKILMPKWNSGTQRTSLVRSMIDTDEIPFSFPDNGYVVPCTAQSHSGNSAIRCVLKPATITDIESIATARDILQVTLQSFSLADGETFSFKTTGSSFRNPPSTKAISTFVVQSLTQNSAMIDEQTRDISFSVSTPATILSDRVSISAPVILINEEVNFQFTIEMPVPLPVGAIIEITIPTQISMYSDAAKTQKILTGALGVTPLFSNPSVTIIDQATQKIQVSNLVPSYENYVDEDNPFSFSLIQLKNPGSIQQSATFGISIYDQNDLILNIDPDGLTYTASPGILNEVSYTPENYRTRQEVPYLFELATTNNLYVSGDIAVILPEELSVNPDNLSFSGFSSISLTNTIILSWDEDKRTIFIDNAFDTAWAAPVLVSFSIDSGIINAPSEEPIPSIEVQTLDHDGQVIDIGQSQAGVVYTANEITSIEATACADKQTSSTTQEVCTYRLKYLMGSEFSITGDSQIQITLPDDLEIYDKDLTVSGSYTDGIADLTSEFQVTTNRRTVFVNGAFVQSSAPNGQDYNQDSFSIFIAGIMTPRSTAPTLSFKSKIVNKNGYTQYEKNQGVFSNVYQSKNFQNLGISRTSEANGDDQGQYIFTIVFSTVIYMNEYIKIVPPNGVSVNPESNQCVGILNLSENLSCTISDQSIYMRLTPEDVTVKTQWEAGETISFQVGNIMNPQSFGLTDSFKVYVSSSVQLNYYVSQLESGMSISNKKAGSMTGVQLLPDSEDLGVKTNYAIYFTIGSELPVGSYVDITFPQEYFTELDQIACEALKTGSARTTCSVPTGETYNVATGAIVANPTNVIRISDSFNIKAIQPNTEIAYLLRNVRNPDASVDSEVISKQFSIMTLSPDGYPIDASNNLSFSIGCVFPCQTCEGDQSTCLTCQIVDLVPLVFFPELSTCRATCPQGYRRTDDYVCEKCQFPCTECSKAIDVCDSCDTAIDDFVLDVERGLCFTECPSLSYKDEATLSCLPCVNNCANCLGPDVCLDCELGTYFLDEGDNGIKGQCLPECPLFAITVEERSECELCREPCYTCEGTTDFCVSCLTGYFLYGNECVSECPRNYQVDDNQACVRAAEPTLPFVTMIGPVLFMLIIGVSMCIDRRTKPIVAFIALQSSWMVGFWVYQLIYLMRDQHESSPIIIAAVLLANYACNCWFYEYARTRLMNGTDEQFKLYLSTHRGTQKSILNWAMLTSFQLFRFLYSGMCGRQRYLARMDTRQRYYKRLNRYTLFQITFSYMPAIAASAYNLFYTWYGRQIFWIDIECIGMSAVMIVLHTIIIMRTQKEHVVRPIDNPLNQSAPADGKPAARDKYLQDPLANDLGDEIYAVGFKGDVHRERLAEMTDKQRMGTLGALYKRMFTKKQKQVETEGYKIKHGRGLEVNRDLFADDDLMGQQAYAQAGVAIVKDGTFPPVIPNIKQKKMQMYSSVGAEERARIASIQEHREGLEYRAFDGNDVTVPDADDALGATQALDTIQQQKSETTARRDGNGKLLKDSDKTYAELLNNDTTQQDLNASPLDGDDDVLRFENDGQQMNSLRAKNNDEEQDQVDFNGIIGIKSSPSENSDVTYGIDREIYNFQSAPMNAKTALDGNRGLQERYEQFQNELNMRGIPQAKKLQEGRLNQKRRLNRVNKQKYDSMPRLNKNKHQETDSDDHIEDLNSSKWGAGTSQVLAQHYSTVQQNKKLKKFEGSFKGSLKDPKDGDDLNKMTADEFAELIATMEAQRALKKQFKKDGAQYGEQRDDLQGLIRESKHDVGDLDEEIKSVQAQIDEALILLKEAEEKRAKDKAFVENAFYTSNEEGMGVSPTLYEGQNRNPRRPGTRDAKSAVDANHDQRKLDDPLDEFQESLHQILPDQLIEDQMLGNGDGQLPIEFDDSQRLSAAQQQQDSDGYRNAQAPQNVEGSAGSPPARFGGDVDLNEVLNEDADLDEVLNIGGGTISGQELNGAGAAFGAGLFGAGLGAAALTGKSNDKTPPLKKEPNSPDLLAKAKNSSASKLKHNALTKDDQEFEYYTSEDENGRRVQKLRKKKGRRAGRGGERGGRGTRSKDPKIPKPLNDQSVKYNEKAKVDTGLAELRMSGRGLSTEAGRGSKTQNGRGLQKQPTGRGLQSEAGRGRSVTGQAVLTGAGIGTAAAINNLDKDSRERSKNGTYPTQNSHRDSQRESQRQQRVWTLRDNGQAVMETNGTASKQPRKRSKKRQQTQQPVVEYSGAYFKHTNFEKAVIATNGKAPYNNKEVELITKPEGFDPNAYKFKNNWVNNLIQSGKKSPHHEDAGQTDFNPVRSQEQLSGIPSASVTATTVFQGYNPEDDGGIKGQEALGGTLKREGRGSDPLDRPVTPTDSFHALQNNLVNDSPVTMMNMSDDKGRLGTAGDGLLRAASNSNVAPNSIHGGTEVRRGGSSQTEGLDDQAIVMHEKARGRGKPTPATQEYKILPADGDGVVEDFGGKPKSVRPFTPPKNNDDAQVPVQVMDSDNKIEGI